MLVLPDVEDKADTVLTPAAPGDSDTTIERLLADLAVRLVALEPSEIDGAIADSLRQVAGALGVDRAILWRRTGAPPTASATHRWPDSPEADASREPPTAGLPPSSGFEAESLGALHSIVSRLEAGEATWFTRVEEVPGAVDRITLRRQGIRSAVFIPVAPPGEGASARRALGLLATTGERAWGPTNIASLQVLARLLGLALARQASVAELQWALDELEQMCRRGREAGEVARAELATFREQVEVERVQLRREVRTLKGSRLLAVDSPAARQVLAQIEQVAPTTATVLMLGETGSGKEVFAEALHAMSPRRNKPIIRVNCAAIPTALIESELFGRERGAYTGALSRQIGRFEAADGSTIFLDEVGELPLEVQVKLLRVLQDRVIERLGSPQPIRVNVRVIAATNRDLEQAVADKTFREDLYYRLNVFPIRIPPLRERVEDIPALVWSFIDEFATAFGKPIESLAKSSLVALQSYGWPGNVRELRNTVERAVIVASGRRLDIAPPRAIPAIRLRSTRMVDMEIDHIRHVLTLANWRVRGRAGAAELLGLKPTTLESRMLKLGISRDSHRSTVAAGVARRAGA